MQQQIIMFDFDNTIVDSLKYWNNLQNKKVFKLFKTKPVKNFAELRKGLKNDDYIEFLKQFVKDKTSKQIYDTLYKNMEYHYLHDVKFVNGAKEYLYKLKSEGKTLILASATWTKLLKKVLKHFDINIFDKIYTEPDLGYSKKQPEFFDIVLKDLGCKPEEIYFYEDSISSLKTSAGLGIQCCAIKHRFNKHKINQVSKKCDSVITNFKKLI